MAGLGPKRVAPTPVAEPRTDSDAVVRALVQALQGVRVDNTFSPAVDVPAPQVTVMPAATPRQWKFTVKRDKDGFISEIVANATEIR